MLFGFIRQWHIPRQNDQTKMPLAALLSALLYPKLTLLHTVASPSQDCSADAKELKLSMEL
jgi:hypothetical protein